MSPLARSLLALSLIALLHAACAAALPKYCNSVLIAMLGFPWRCSASSMFAESRVDDFFAVLRKRRASFMEQVRRTDNGILRTVYEGCTKSSNEAIIQHLTIDHEGLSMVLIPDLVYKPGAGLVAQEVFVCNWEGTGAPDVTAPPKGFSPVQVKFGGKLPQDGLQVYVVQYSDMIVPPLLQ